MRSDDRTPFPDARKIPLPRRWRESRDGNIAVMFAIILFAVLGVVGASTDYGRKLSAVAKAQGAADAAALAIAANPKTADENLTTAKNVIGAYLTGAAGLNIVVTQPASLAYRVTLTYKMPTSLMQVIGFRTMDVAVSSDASAGSGGPVEVALARSTTPAPCATTCPPCAPPRRISRRTSFHPAART
jgi:Flp pilus assembly protein TadG